MTDEGRAPEVDQEVDAVEGVPVPEVQGVLVEGEAGCPQEGAPEAKTITEGGQPDYPAIELPDPAQAILDTWNRVKQEREAQGLIGRSPRSKTPLQLANQQGATWKRGLERFTRLKVDDVVAELSEMGVGTFARGILLAMEGPECPLCHRGGEPWAYQTYAKVARVIGDDTMQALALKSLGVSLEVIQRAMKLWESTGSATPEEADRVAQEYLQARGWRCLPPAAEVR